MVFIILECKQALCHRQIIMSCKMDILLQSILNLLNLFWRIAKVSQRFGIHCY